MVTDGLRRYRYVGPPEVLAVVRPGSDGHLIGSPDDFAAWLATCGVEELAEPFTFVVGVDGILRVAPRA